MVNLKNKPKTIEVKYEDLDQFDFNGWNEELTTKKEAYYASHIGTFLIWFSNLEHALDLEIVDVVNTRGHDIGYMVIKDLDMSAKIELFYNLLFPLTHFDTKKGKQKLNHLASIKKELIQFSELRNKIAHAKWNTLDKDGYVRVDTKTKKEDGLIKFKKVRISPTIMRQSIKKMATTTDKLNGFTEYLMG